MGFLDSIEKLINEHGSSTILKERIALLNDQHAFIEQQAGALKEQVAVLTSQNEHLAINNQQLQKQIDTFKSTQHSNPNNYACDHCGSNNLKRIGSRPNATFDDVGIKDAIFVCLDCNKESAFIQDDLKGPT